MIRGGGDKAPSAASIQIEPRAPSCPIARHQVHAAAVKAMINRERERPRT